MSDDVQTKFEFAQTIYKQTAYFLSRNITTTLKELDRLAAKIQKIQCLVVEIIMIEL